MTIADVPSAYRRYLIRGRALLPVILVLTSLSLLALLPMVTMRITEGLYAHISNDAEAAREHVWDMQHALTLESAATRAYLLTADSAAVVHHQNARRARERAMQELLRLAPRLDPETGRLSRELAARLAVAEPARDSLFAGTLTRSRFLSELMTQSERLESVLEASADVDRAIAAETERSLRKIQRTQAISAVLTIVFVLMAVLAAAMVANLTRQYLESEGRFRQIAESLHDFVWLADRDFRSHLFANEAYERIWGRPRSELHRGIAAVLDAVHPDDADRVRHAFASPPEAAYDVEYRVVRPDGSVRWVWTRVFPVRNNRGEVYRIAGITEDITDRKLAADSRVRLIRGFTHDVKNPLGAADGHLALLQDGIIGPLTQPQLESIGRARRSLRAALNLVTQLLDIARAEAGQIEVHRAPTDVVAITREVVDEFRAQAIAQGAELALQPPPGETRIIVESDAARIRQVLANLVSNAVKYGAVAPGARITVSITREQNGEQGSPAVAITVSDTGPGIPYEKQNLIFREFTRFNPAAAQGSGIGLAISQRIARALDGSITFRSRPGEGTAFTLWLPAKPAGSPTRRAPPDERRSAPPSVSRAERSRTA